MGRRLLPLLALLLAPASAHAVRAGEKTPPEFGRLDRARVPDRARQAALTASPEWRRFTAQFGNQWRVTWDDRAGTPRSIIGARIPLVAENATAAEVEAASRTFLDSIGYLSGVTDAQLRTSVLEKINGAWYVRFDRVTRSGDEVAGAFAELRIVRGAIVLIRLETHPAAEAAPIAKLAAMDAVSRAHAELKPWVASATLRGNAKKKIVPVAAGKTWTYRPAFEVETVATRAAKWRSVVDAVYGDVLARESLVRYAVDGQLNAMVEPRTVGDTLASMPLAHVNASVGGAPVSADLSGFYTEPAAAAPASIAVSLVGPYVNVNNEAGADAATTFTANNASGNVHTWTSSTGGQEQAQLDAYVSANVAKEWARTVTPSLSWLNQSLPVNVNINDECNAYWDGSSINFFDEGSQCNNTARIADVVYHEFGHGFHQNVAESGVIDGAIGEGTGDFIAATITGSPVIGPNFIKNGDEVRDIEPNRVYPDDVIGQVHNDGLIWGGALWDLRKALITKHGEATGRLTVDTIFARALVAGPTLDQTYDEVILADDDDGNLANGTPNQCEIDAAFGAHGLSGASSAFSLVHDEVTGPVAAGAVQVSAAKPETNALCAGSTIESATLRYRVDDGAAQSVALSASGDEFTGEIPGLQEGSVVRYWFEGRLEDGTTVTTPPRAPENVFAFYVGPLFTVWKDDFEGENLWESGGSGSDWEIGSPNGSSSDPATAYSGTKAFGNSVGDDGAYMPGANNWAQSPVIDCRGCRGTRLQLRRWLTVEDASYDFARILVNGIEVYQNPVGPGNGGALPKDPMWSFQDYDISDIADGEEIAIRFELESDGGVEYGGWTLDDVAIVTPSEPGAAPGDDGYGLFGCGCNVESRDSRVLAGPLALLALAFLPFLRRRGLSHRVGA